jgi:hypothetical protein
MRRIRLTVEICTLLVLLAGTAHADPITITFDDTGPGTYLSSFYQSAGIRFASHNSPTGETFEVNTGRFQILDSSSAISQPNAAAPSAPIGEFTFTDISGRFVIFDTVSWTVNFLSLGVIGTAPAQTIPWILNLYDPQNQLLESRQGTTDMLLTFARPGIGSFALFGTGREMIDNLAFTPDPVPEPATMMMIGTGLAGLGLRLRRRRRDGAE